MMCKITVRKSSLLAGISLLQIIILIAVSIFDNWLVLLSIMPLLCITFMSQSGPHTRKRAAFIKAKGHQGGKSCLF